MDILRAHFNNVHMCPPPPLTKFKFTHLQTRNITFCYNKQGIITKDIDTLQDKGPNGI